MPKIVLVSNLEGYEVIDHVVVSTMKQPQVVRIRFRELFGRLNGTTKDFYKQFVDAAALDAKADLMRQCDALGADAICQIDIRTDLKDVRGDVFITANAQCVALRRKGTVDE